MDDQLGGNTMAAYSGKLDAYGHLLYDYLNGNKNAIAIVERDDGMINHGGDTGMYFAEFRKWQNCERQAMKHVRGRVLDIGCGGGRVLLHLQKKGFECLGIDNSPLAVKVCRIRGARDARLMSVTRINPAMGIFDIVVMFGNNFGLVGNPRGGRWWLKKMLGMTSEQGRILAHSLNPYQTDIPEHLEYHRLNRKRGRLGGQTRIKIRYHKYATPWLDLLLVSPNELARLVKGTGWIIDRIIKNDDDPRYVAVLAKEK